MPRNTPLKKNTVTQGSQVILPAYPILFLLIAGFLLFQDPSRTQGESFEVALMIVSIGGWGLVFLLIGAVQVFCLMGHRRKTFMWSLVARTGMCAFWAILLFASATRNHSVSWTSGVWVMFVAVAHIASVRSLSRDDVRI